MKLKLTSRNRMPYGGLFEWSDPLTGITVKGSTWNMLVERATAQRNANGIPIGLEFQDEIEAQLCRDYPAECFGFDPRMPKPVTVAFADILHGTRVMVAHKLAGSPLVSDEEANRRAQICASCILNQPYQVRCSNCRDIENLVVGVLGTKTTKLDTRLKACGICKCALKAAVWLPLEIQCVGVSAEQKEQFKLVDHCWKVCG